jgi:hypothetical protein
MRNFCSTERWLISEWRTYAAVDDVAIARFDANAVSLPSDLGQRFTCGRAFQIGGLSLYYLQRAARFD